MNRDPLQYYLSNIGNVWSTRRALAKIVDDLRWEYIRKKFKGEYSNAQQII